MIALAEKNLADYEILVFHNTSQDCTPEVAGELQK